MMLFSMSSSSISEDSATVMGIPDEENVTTRTWQMCWGVYAGLLLSIERQEVTFHQVDVRLDGVISAKG